MHCTTGESHFWNRGRPLTLSIDLIFHPAGLNVAALALSFGSLINVISYKATLPVSARHVLVVVTLGILGRGLGVFCHDMRRGRAVQFGHVTKGIRSLHGIRWRRGRRQWFLSAAAALCLRFPPKTWGHENRGNSGIMRRMMLVMWRASTNFHCQD